MTWKKLNEYAKIWEKPVLGSVDQKDGKRYMALCIDPESKNPYKGIARQIIEREENPNMPSFLDKSKLILVESHNLLKWDIIGDLNIKRLQETIQSLEENGKEFIGLEDPDILVDKNGKKHVYFSIAFKYKGRDGYDVYVGHAEGNSLESLKATEPVLGKVNSEIVGFKEICPIPLKNESMRFVLAETFVDKGGERKYSAISVSKCRNLSEKWDYQKLVHDPEKEIKNWCAGHSSPCRIFDPNYLSHNKYFVGIMNGREPTKKIDGKKLYGKFRPGLFLFDNKHENIVWVDDEPLLEDPIATTITFASELVTLNKKEAILYAQINDSFVRAYKINLEKIKERLPKVSLYN